MNVTLPDRLVAPVLSIGAIGLYLSSGFGHGSGESGYGQLASRILSGEAPATVTAVPALFVIPFLVASDAAPAQAFASAVAGGLSAGASYLVLRRLGAGGALSTTLALFSVAGTALWFGSADSRDAYLAQSVAVLFSTLALLAAVDRRPAFLAALLLAAATLSRPPLALAAAGLAFLSVMYGQRSIAPTFALIAVGMAPVIAVAIAFGGGLQGLAAASLSVANVPRHLYAAAMQAPDYVGEGGLFVRPLWVGTSLLLTSPTFVFALAALRYLRRFPEVRALALAAALPLMVDVLGPDIGEPQFGYRLALDAQPFLLPLAALGGAWSDASWARMRWTFVASVIWSIAANLYGVVAILRLGFVR